jgi:hypothetical protein
MQHRSEFYQLQWWECCNNQSKPISLFQYSKLWKLGSKTNFICNFSKEMPELPTKWNSQYLSCHISEWDESSLLIIIISNLEENKF